jgi:hypothetical protein
VRDNHATPGAPQAAIAERHSDDHHVHSEPVESALLGPAHVNNALTPSPITGPIMAQVTRGPVVVRPMVRRGREQNSAGNGRPGNRWRGFGQSAAEYNRRRGDGKPLHPITPVSLPS